MTAPPLITKLPPTLVVNALNGLFEPTAPVKVVIPVLLITKLCGPSMESEKLTAAWFEVLSVLSEVRVTVPAKLCAPVVVIDVVLSVKFPCTLSAMPETGALKITSDPRSVVL